MSTQRFYFYDPKTNEELRVPFTNEFEGCGRRIGIVKGLMVRDEIYVGVKNTRKITIADFPGRECVKVKFWDPHNANEWFYLSSEAALAKYGF